MSSIKRRAFYLAIFGAQTFFALCSPISTAASDEVQPGRLVMTPAGLFPVSNIHLVPEGGRVHHTSKAIHLLDADGGIVHTSPIDDMVHPTSIHQALRLPTLTSSIVPRAFNSGYVAYSYWKNTNPSPISFFSTTLTVPPFPAKIDGQLLYLFNGLIPNSFDGILQPVLQFGSSPAGGGNYWAVASWYLVNSNIYFTTPKQVDSGKVITGVMTLTNSTTSGNTTTYNWNSVFTNMPSTSLSISTTEALTYAYEALEIYSVSGASELPRGSTKMSSINIVTQDGRHPNVNWTVVKDKVDGFELVVVKNGSTNGEVDITYP
ncbi:hypothetical protein CPC08DRAFT_709373 [Agrocybe pediades]|nr:hypothetical protein CPC08DRAFT_709373 [Agrocybe pediades]